MANTSAPAGLAPVQYLSGSPYNGQARMYSIASTDNNAFAIGDPVVPSGTAEAGGIMGVTLATGGTANAVLGAIVGISSNRFGATLDPTNLSTTIIPATKTKIYYVLVADDPHILFEIQEGGAGAALTITDIGNNANLLTGVNNGFVSGWTFNNATLATTATLQLKLFGLVQRADNTFGASAKWLVKINNHYLGSSSAGI